MYVFKVNNDEYNVKYSYRVLCETDLIDRVIDTMASGDDDKDGATQFKDLLKLTAELLLAGLQKYHRDEFGYDTDSEKKEKLFIVYDMIDDYEDEHRDEPEDSRKDSATLFIDLQGELENNGFLSRIGRSGQENLEEQNATVVPMDHQKSSKKKNGAKA